MRNVKVYRPLAEGSYRYVGQFPWIESAGIDAAHRWAYQHGYRGPLLVMWAY